MAYRDPHSHRDPRSPRGLTELPDHYAALGLSPACTAAEIKAAWKTAAKRWHPDRVEGAAHDEGLSAEQIEHRIAGAATSFRTARTAYDVLRSASERADYDAARVRLDHARLDQARWARERAADHARWAQEQATWDREQAKRDSTLERLRYAEQERRRRAEDLFKRTAYYAPPRADVRTRADAQAVCDFVAVVTRDFGFRDPFGAGPWVRSDILLPLD